MDKNYAHHELVGLLKDVSFNVLDDPCAHEQFLDELFEGLEDLNLLDE